MKFIFFFSIYFLSIVTGFCQYKMKVACVGNSITWGVGVFDQKNNCYPAQLQHMLGGSNEVRNFGHTGATLLKKGSDSYWHTDAYKDALTFNPDIVS